MKTTLIVLCAFVLGSAMPAEPVAAEPTAAADRLEPIKTVQIGPNREFMVNGKPFFPIMSWAQASKRYKKLHSVGINTFVGDNDGAATCLKAAEDAGGYHVSHFDPTVIGNPYLLGWIQGDEPDLPTTVQDIKLTAEKIAPHNRARLGGMFDGNPDSRAVLGPLPDLTFSVRWPKPVTVTKFRIKAGNDATVIQLKDIELIGDGASLVKTTLAKSSDPQEIPLAKPATFRELEVRLPTVYAGEGVDTDCYELEGLDAEGNNVLAAPRTRQPRKLPPEVITGYKKVRAVDKTRPVFMTLTAGFMKADGRHADKYKALYPQYVQAADVVGFDYYPIYGYNKPENLTYVADGVSELRALAGPKRPVYAWIESSKGSRWITYSKQLDVLPKHTRAEVWMAIIRGATGIGYFTHAWRPSFTEFAPTEEMQAELTRLNGQITRLAPAILAPESTRKITMTAGDETPCHFKATALGGYLHIFAQNIDLKDQTATVAFGVEGLPEGASVEVVDEARTIGAASGGFTDTIEPLRERIYRIKLTGK